MGLGAALSPWLLLLRRLKARMVEHNLLIIAAGVAFYALLAIFPALAALVALYGLVLDPEHIGQLAGALQGVLPDQVLGLLQRRLRALAQADRGSLGLGAAGGFVLALWVASAAVRGLIRALNVAYGQHEGRGLLRRAGWALLLTFATLVGGAVAIALMVLLPATVRWLRLEGLAHGLAAYGPWLVVAGLGWLGLLALYRWGPARPPPPWSWFNPGALTALTLWLTGSVLFSKYVEQVADYTQTYGSAGAVAVLLIWLLLSSCAVLVGAELNAELEQGSERRGHGSPAGPRGPSTGRAAMSRFS